MNSNQKSVSPIPQHPSPISDLQSHNSFWELAVILIAALVRFWRLNYHSIWFDEAVSLNWAQRPISEIWSPLLTFVPDKHPPLYYVLLHGWMKLIGLLGLTKAVVR